MDINDAISIEDGLTNNFCSLCIILMDTIKLNRVGHTITLSHSFDIVSET